MKKSELFPQYSHFLRCTNMLLYHKRILTVIQYFTVRKYSILIMKYCFHLNFQVSTFSVIYDNKKMSTVSTSEPTISFLFANTWDYQLVYKQLFSWFNRQHDSCKRLWELGTFRTDRLTVFSPLTSHSEDVSHTDVSLWTDMATRVAVVTGGNKGIGLAIVRELCRRFQGVVYLTARDV